MTAVFPIGFVAGRYRFPSEGTRSYVRAGRQVHGLVGDEYAVWAAAHGPVGTMSTRWGRDTVIDVLAQTLGDDAAEPGWAAQMGEAFDRLLERGLVVDLGADDAQVERFAAAHRFRCLQGGLGQSADDADLEIVGTASHAVATLQSPLFGVWQLAGQAVSLLSAADQLVAEAAEFGDVLTRADCLTKLLADLRGLAALGLGYFDAVPEPDGPIRYLDVALHIPIDPEAFKEPSIVPANRLLTESEYRSKLSGAPEGLRYLVADPETGEDVAFAGFAQGRLFDTVASIAGRSREALVAQARRQLAAAGRYPLVWHVQQADDVDGIRALLEDAGLSGVEVRHTPAP